MIEPKLRGVRVCVSPWQVVTGFTGQWPGPWNEDNQAVREHSLDKVYIFDPKADKLRTGCDIPTAHRRGSAGVGAHLST